MRLYSLRLYGIGHVTFAGQFHSVVPLHFLHMAFI